MLHISCEITPIFRGFKSTVFARLNANESRWMAVYSRCVYYHFKFMVIHKGFSAREFGCQCT